MSESETTTRSESQPEAVVGLVARFEGPEALKKAARAIRDAGYRRWDTHSPFPVHGIDGAMGIRPTVLPWLVLGAGITGGVVGLVMQWWTNAVAFPFIISGKPFFSLPANIPITFELIVLFSALTAFVGVLALNQLPQFTHPLFRNEQFKRVTNDGFFVSIDATDPHFDEVESARLLEEAGGVDVELCRDTAVGREIPHALYWALAVMAILALVPPTMIAGHRAVKHRMPRFHPIPDMDHQLKFKPQTANALFSDGRAMRPPVPGTIAVGRLNQDEAFFHGQIDGEWISEFPMPVTMETMRRGQERFGIYCVTCHGWSGQGNGIINERALKRLEPGWKPPPTLYGDYVAEQPVGKLFGTITGGIFDKDGNRTMPPYATQIPVADRWAIVAYLRAIQRSQNPRPDDMPEGARRQ